MPGTMGTCWCGAMRYASRKSARKAARRVPDHKAKHLSAESCGAYWHVVERQL